MFTKLLTLSAPALVLILVLAGFVSTFNYLFGSIEASGQRPAVAANNAGFYR